MNIVFKLFDLICYFVFTIFAKIRWPKSMNLTGLLQRRIDAQICIEDGGKIYIDKNVAFQKNVSLTAVHGGRLTIGKNVSFNRYFIAICHKEITIKNRVIFGPGVTIYDHDHKFSKDGIFQGFNCGSVIIEQGCWIGANVTILRGTHIGENCVIGAGTIIKGDIPAHTLVVGDRQNKLIPLQ